MSDFSDDVSKLLLLHKEAVWLGGPIPLKELQDQKDYMSEKYPEVKSMLQSKHLLVV